MAMALSRLSHLRPALSRSLPALLRSPLEISVSRPCLWQKGCGQCGALTLSQSRHLATKKNKAKGKGQPQARVSINSALVEDIINLEEVKEEMNAVIENLKEDYSRNLSIRTSPGALDHITVTTKDGKFPLNQLGQISMKSPQLILVNMTSFPEAIAAASKAIRESGMNLNPEVDGTLVRVPIPKEHTFLALYPFSKLYPFNPIVDPPETLKSLCCSCSLELQENTGENLAKLAKPFTNKAKESLRKVRTNAVNQAKRSKDTVSEDTIKLIEKQIQQMVDDVAADMDKQLTTKTKELLG